MGRRFSSALIMRRFFLSCRPFRLMYAQSFLVTSVRGIGLLPITSASWSLGFIAFMNAAFGLRFVAFLAVLRAGFLAVFFAAFFVLFLLDFFALFLAAIVNLPERVGAVNTAETTSMTAHKVRNSHPIAIGERRFSLWRRPARRRERR